MCDMVSEKNVLTRDKDYPSIKQEEKHGLFNHAGKINVIKILCWDMPACQSKGRNIFLLDVL